MRSKTKICAAAGSLAVLLLSAAQPALADPVGLVQRVQNAVYGTEPQGSRTPKQRRDGIVADELIETTQHSAIEIGFIDGSDLVIGAEAKVTIDRFAFDAGANSGEAVLTLTRGAFRWITGVMPKGGVSLETPTATITIRGTNLKLGVRANGDTLLGLVDGEVDIRAKGTGASAKLSAGQSARVTSNGIEIIDDVISVADAIVDDGWFNAIGRDNSSRARDGDSEGGGGNN
ncbi:FecR family protein [Dongia rigui]|uniref:FecR domain-containing protein n=1 Tax=Dongia rigui TaxID=940149 RepID=A0ABU5DVA5_9PROT|nr:FecR domain-containing protein [Dongia rigui]MDY0871236.1 FecR domain-containing protein [Dongia rigui]